MGAHRALEKLEPLIQRLKNKVGGWWSHATDEMQQQNQMDGKLQTGTPCTRARTREALDAGGRNTTTSNKIDEQIKHLIDRIMQEKEGHNLCDRETKTTKGTTLAWAAKRLNTSVEADLGATSIHNQGNRLWANPLGEQKPVTLAREWRQPERPDWTKNSEAKISQERAPLRADTKTEWKNGLGVCSALLASETITVEDNRNKRRNREPAELGNNRKMNRWHAEEKRKLWWAAVENLSVGLRAKETDAGTKLKLLTQEPHHSDPKKTQKENRGGTNNI
jgi:hypothetical protein